VCLPLLFAPPRKLGIQKFLFLIASPLTKLCRFGIIHFFFCMFWRTPPSLLISYLFEVPPPSTTSYERATGSVWLLSLPGCYPRGFSALRRILQQVLLSRSLAVTTLLVLPGSMNQASTLSISLPTLVPLVMRNFLLLPPSLLTPTPISRVWPNPLIFWFPRF